MVKSTTVLSRAGEDVESLAKQAYVTLRDRIVSLELPPGALLSETTLGESMGISRTPIREALKRLELDYLIAIMPRRGIIVTDIDYRDQLLLLDIRRGIEATLFARAAERANPAQRQRFVELAAAMDEVARSNDIRAHYVVDKEFDDLIDLCGGNRFVTDMLRPVHSLVRRFWHSLTGTPDSQVVLNLHVAVAKAVASGEPKRVFAASEALFDFNEQVIRRLLG